MYIILGGNFQNNFRREDAQSTAIGRGVRSPFYVALVAGAIHLPILSGLCTQHLHADNPLSYIFYAGVSLAGDHYSCPGHAIGLLVHCELSGYMLNWASFRRQLGGNIHTDLATLPQSE